MSGSAGSQLANTHLPTSPLQVFGFFKGMSFPLLSIAMVNSVMFGAYSNALLFLSDTPHRERSTRPPGYAHIFGAGCFSGLVQVRSNSHRT